MPFAGMGMNPPPQSTSDRYEPLQHSHHTLPSSPPECVTSPSPLSAMLRLICLSVCVGGTTPGGPIPEKRGSLARDRSGCDGDGGVGVLRLQAGQCGLGRVSVLSRPCLVSVVFNTRKQGRKNAIPWRPEFRTPHFRQREGYGLER